MKKTILITLGIITGIYFQIKAQTVNNDSIKKNNITKADTGKEINKEPIFTIAEQMPEFVGGEQAMYEWMSKNIGYPQLAKSMGISGNVISQFVVEKDGSLSNINILKDIGGGCGAEVVRLLNAMPKWNPGMQMGNYVRVQYVLPIKFTLTNQINLNTTKADTGKVNNKELLRKFAQQIPSFVGGEKAMYDWIYSNMNYPQKAKDNGISGTVYVQFIVKKDGSITHIQMINDIGGGCGVEVIRLVKAMPKWNPALKMGKYVSAQYFLPVNFTLPNQGGNTTKADTSKVKKDEPILTIVEQMPEFVGGEQAMYDWLHSNIKYPQKAKDNGISGNVIVQFVVEKDGSLSCIQILKDIGGGCGAEVKRVLNTMPKWNPGMQMGKYVRVQYILPVKF